VSFPAAELRFQQSALAQPLNGIGISLVWDGKTDARLAWETVDGARQQVAYLKTMVTFWVRVAMRSVANANARKQAQIASDRLYLILQNSGATRPLSQKGIHRLRPKPPYPVADAGYQLRQIVCAAQLRYTVLSQV